VEGKNACLMENGPNMKRKKGQHANLNKKEVTLRALYKRNEPISKEAQEKKRGKNDFSGNLEGKNKCPRVSEGKE